MFTLTDTTAATKAELYDELASQLSSLLHGERNAIANGANFSSLLFHTLPQINWAGFYFLKGDELVLGPFQGKPACIRIPLGKGVCGSAAERRQTIVVDNVDDFPGHIACDGASNSEIVVPLVKNGRLLGVLDIDSPEYSRFDDEDREGLESLAEIYLAASAFDR
jgi:GAF domain-containing protein